MKTVKSEMREEILEGLEKLAMVVISVMINAKLLSGSSLVGISMMSIK